MESGKARDSHGARGSRKVLGRIALGGLLLSSVSGCLGLGLGSTPASTIVLSSNAPVVDESVPERQPARGTDPEAQLVRSAALTARWRRERPTDFGELDRPTGAPRPAPAPSGAAKLDAASPGAPVAGSARLGAPSRGVEMRAAAPAPHGTREPARSHDPVIDAVTALDRLEIRAKSAARAICNHC